MEPLLDNNLVVFVRVFQPPLSGFLAGRIGALLGDIIWRNRMPCDLCGFGPFCCHILQKCHHSEPHSPSIVSVASINYTFVRPPYQCGSPLGGVDASFQALACPISFLSQTDCSKPKLKELEIWSNLCFPLLQNVFIYRLQPVILVAKQHTFEPRGSPVSWWFGIHRWFGESIRSVSETQRGTSKVLYYQPKQCTISREVLQNDHTFALFDPHKMGSLFMTFVLISFATNPKWSKSYAEETLWIHTTGMPQL